MDLFEFEKCFEPLWSSKKTERPFKDWFMKNHHNYQGSYNILEKKDECLREIYKLWIKSDKMATHFWILENGKVVHEDYKAGNPDVSIGSIVLSKKSVASLHRDSIIKDILDED